MAAVTENTKIAKHIVHLRANPFFVCERFPLKGNNKNLLLLTSPFLSRYTVIVLGNY